MTVEQYIAQLLFNSYYIGGLLGSFAIGWGLSQLITFFKKLSERI